MNVFLGRLISSFTRKASEHTHVDREDVDLSTWDLCILSDEKIKVKTLLITLPYIITGGFDGQLILWGTAVGQRGSLLEFAGHTAAITCLCAFTSNHLLIVSGSEDGSARVWCLSSGALIHTVTDNCSPAVLAIVAVSPSGPIGIVSSSGTLSLWEITHSACNPVAEGGSSGDIPHIDLPVAGDSMCCVATIAMESNPHTVIAIDSLGMSGIVVASTCPILRVYQHTHGVWGCHDLVGHDSTVNHLKSLGSEKFCSADDTSVVIWRCSNFLAITSIPIDQILPHHGPINYLATWKDKYIMVAAGSAFTILNPSSSDIREASCLDAHGTDVLVTHVAWHPPVQERPNEQHLISAGADGSIRLWRMLPASTNKRTQRYISPRKTGFLSPLHIDAQWETNSPEETLSVLRRRSPEPKHSYRGFPSSSARDPIPLALFPKGNLVTRLTIQNHLVAEFCGHTDGVLQLEILDPWMVVTTSKDGNTILWINAQHDKQTSTVYLQQSIHEQIVDFANAELRAEGIEIWRTDNCI